VVKPEEGRDMAGFNRVFLIGNLGSDPEMRYTPGGVAVCRFSLATSKKYTNKEGVKVEHTDWHRIVVWRKLAEVCGQYLKKGNPVMIEGRIEYGSYEKDGVKHYTADIVTDSMQMLGGGRRDGGGGSGSEESSWVPPDGSEGSESADPGDIPF
jgi:single-strand DNA-binding protein